jgi:Glyoxalase/Bleomycin resistance protein/Dioxygenase superfamily
MGRDPNTPDWTQHIAFQVEDMDELLKAKARAETTGLEVVGPTDHTIFKSIYFWDPSGHRLEVATWTATPEQLARMKAVAPAMVEEWSRTKKPPRHTAWLHEREFGDARFYAARTVARNLTTSAFRRLFSFESSCADESTWEDAEPVSAAPRLTSAMLVATWVDPRAACCTLRAISWVAAPCSSMAAAIAAAISETRPIVPEISLIATTESCVAACIPAICVEISLVAFAVCAASALTSCATTANPRRPKTCTEAEVPA